MTQSTSSVTIIIIIPYAIIRSSVKKTRPWKEMTQIFSETFKNV